MVGTDGVQQGSSLRVWVDSQFFRKAVDQSIVCQDGGSTISLGSLSAHQTTKRYLFERLAFDGAIIVIRGILPLPNTHACIRK